MYHVAQAAAVHAFMRCGVGGRLGRGACSRLLNRVAPPGGDGGLRYVVLSNSPVSLTAWFVAVGTIVRQFQILEDDVSHRAIVIGLIGPHI